METRKFNEEASKLGDKIQIITVSMDLPFAQKRWCGAAGVNKIQTFSDHRDAQFGLAYGVLIKELRLLARAVFLVDQKGIVTIYSTCQGDRKRAELRGDLECVKKISIALLLCQRNERNKLRHNPREVKDES